MKLRRKGASVGVAIPSSVMALAELRTTLDRLDAMDLAVADDAESGAVGSAADAVGHLLAAAGDLAAGIGVDAEMALRRQADALTAQIIDHELT